MAFRACAHAFLFGLAAFAISDASAATTYSTSGAPTQYQLGDQIGFLSPYDVLAVGGYSGALVDGGTAILNTLTFTTGFNGFTPGTISGVYSISETISINGGGAQPLNIPFNLTLGFLGDTLTIVGGTTISVLDGSSLWQIVVNPLTLGSQNSGTTTAFLTAHVTDPPVSAAPLPGALPLFASGLAAMGLFGAWKAKRKIRQESLSAG